jgi:hypothetical protein
MDGLHSKIINLKIITMSICCTNEKKFPEKTVYPHGRTGEKTFLILKKLNEKMQFEM